MEFANFGTSLRLAGTLDCCIFGCSGAHGLTQKLYNWTTLNQRVFKKLDFVLAKSECEAVVNCDPGAVERVLKLVKVKLEKYSERQSQQPRYSTFAMFA